MTQSTPTISEVPSTLGRPCSSSNNHVDPLYFKFISDCDAKTFCSAPSNGTCQPRLCRQDEFLYGYLPGEPLPPLCPDRSFCPDDGSGCMEQKAVGEPCEMGRDEQCAPMQDWKELGVADKMNVNGSICLKGVCSYVFILSLSIRPYRTIIGIHRYANIGMNQPCSSEVISHEYKAHDGQHYINLIARDNCLTASLFCDNQTAICQPSKGAGESCMFHRDCQSVGF